VRVPSALAKPSSIGGEDDRIEARADVAQLVEHLHGKEGVSGSSPDVGFARFGIAKRFRAMPVLSQRIGGDERAPGI
jgi:hypothetical protein